MSELHIGPHTRPDGDHGDHGAESTFDREINLRVVLYSGVGLVAIALLSALAMWYLLKGFATYDKHRDVKMTPIAAANPQPPPPAPRLQVAPGFAVLNPGEAGAPVARSDREDMQAERDQEDKILSQPAWVDAAHGTARLPIEVAMQVIAARGVAPFAPVQAPGAPQRNTKPGATLQNTVPQVPARQDNERAGTRQSPASPPPEERRQP